LADLGRDRNPVFVAQPGFAVLEASEVAWVDVRLPS
jgi:hypothetical protein